ncbi:ABC transporter ATP-binding protein [Hoeflea sp. 108]|jgi:peptide/nickel transport system ATP-binding protein|uniref:ABC transporter ATP-binding protein n=1 Tax=Hoeflea sp. 108 TaxID=1116369 RepID=UPI00037EDA7A|nr:ABC transporter ATP-binding protein [Hoeflea sp. 108]
MSEPAIKIENLNIHFGGLHAVRDASFSVNRGECYGIVGESGSGKSTILRAISGLNPNWTGTVEIDGQPQTQHRPKSFYRTVQMVFQDPYSSLHPRHTIDRTLSEPISIFGLDRSEERIRTALERVGLRAGFRFRYPHQLSGGQRQRVAIARAAILEPSILLLDEPTSALDVSIQAEVLNLLKELLANSGLTMILVSHNLAVVAHMCQRVAVMNGGRIVEETTSDALRDGRVREDYTARLLAATRSYNRAAAHGLNTFD